MDLLLIDDHSMVGEALGKSLAATGQFATTHVVTSVEEALARFADGARHDFILVDWHLPGLHGEAAITALLRVAPNARIAVCSGEGNPGIATTSLAVGAHGFLPKTMSVRQLAGAIQLIMSGAVYVPPDILANATRRPDTDLSDRELEVVRGVALGRSNKELARELDLAEVTIKLHLRTAMKKLGVTNRTQAAMRARDIGLV